MSARRKCIKLRKCCGKTNHDKNDRSQTLQVSGSVFMCSNQKIFKNLITRGCCTRDKKISDITAPFSKKSGFFVEI